MAQGPVYQGQRLYLVATLTAIVTGVEFRVLRPDNVTETFDQTDIEVTNPSSLVWQLSYLFALVGTYRVVIETSPSPNEAVDSIGIIVRAPGA